eukprot:TRINITY_DN12279_c0_g1_i1.p1 TRINITY_DN12279_c0_g1~~TRINITY_DN12279_c0_g1_i1.p1  ORF type:complete len:335 (+),score=38.43 TRINITY_DN12279_c0_g1_i1:82-1086(+)
MGERRTFGSIPSSRGSFTSPSWMSSERSSNSTAGTLGSGLKLERFELVAKIGAGAFGQVYEAFDRLLQKSVALKVEKADSTRSQLKVEVSVYKRIDERWPGLPKIFYSESHGNFNVLAIELLGPNLEELLTYCGRCFTLNTVLMIGEQIFRVLQHLHSVGYVHRDLKPPNFTMGLGERGNHVYLIDFGLSKRFLRDYSEDHIPFRMDKGFVGTSRYAPIASHAGAEQGRKDDLESVCYVLLYLRQGSLPWQGGKGTKTVRRKYIHEKKQSCDPSTLGADMKILTPILTHVKRLSFKDKPDYPYILQLFDKAFKTNNITRNWAYDWLKGLGPPVS